MPPFAALFAMIRRAAAVPCRRRRRQHFQVPRCRFCLSLFFSHVFFTFLMSLPHASAIRDDTSHIMFHATMLLFCSRLHDIDMPPLHAFAALRQPTFAAASAVIARRGVLCLRRYVLPPQHATR